MQPQQIITTKLTIEDIIAAAKSAGVSCENCKNWNLENENVSWAKCAADFTMSNLYVETKKDFFCKEFKPKETE